MLRFIYVILLNLFRAPYMIPKMRREELTIQKSIQQKNAMSWQDIASV